MSDRPITSPDDARGGGEYPRSAHATPDPHRGEPLPPTQEGLRPEADPSLARPEQEEENPVGGLLHGAANAVEAEATSSPAAEAESNRLGFEPEGIEGGQLFGLGLATILSVISVILVIYFLFYSPQLQATQDEAGDVPADRYVELREAQAAGQELLSDYATNADSTYRMPIGAAMQAVAADYGTSQRVPPGRGANVSPGSFNTAGVVFKPPQAVQRPGTAAPSSASPAEVLGAGLRGAAPAGAGSTATDGPPAGVPVVGPSDAPPRPTGTPNSARPVGGGTNP